MLAENACRYVVVERSYALASYLVEYPNTVVRVFERGNYTYFRYDADAKKFMWRRPSNKRNNRWHIAYVLENAMHTNTVYWEEL